MDSPLEFRFFAVYSDRLAPRSRARAGVPAGAKPMLYSPGHRGNDLVAKRILWGCAKQAD